MPKDELKATDATLQGLLEGERLYLAPILQRRFVWTRKELDELWDDIDQIIQGVDKSRFLGALVLQHRSGGLAFEPNTYWIIDGQQRLITLYLLLLVIVELAEQRGRTKRLAADLVQVLLNQSNRHKNQPKLRPTNSDLRQFGDVLKRVEGVTIAIPEAVGHPLGRLRNMREMLRGDLEQRLEEEGNTYLKRLADLVLTKLKFVQILTSDDENPHLVFERLNNAGQRLQIVDLVRNAVFQKFGGRVSDQESFYHSSWKPFEDVMGEKLIDGYFFPFALIHRPSTTQAQVFGDLKARWRASSAPDILTELKTYVPEYLALQTSAPLPLGAEIQSAVNRLSRMPVPTSTYPYLMRLLYAVRSEKADKTAAVNILRLTESFLVRRAFAGFEPTGLHALFKNLWKETIGGAKTILTVIEDNPTIQFPGDDQFREDIRTGELYCHPRCETPQ